MRALATKEAGSESRRTVQSGVSAHANNFVESADYYPATATFFGAEADCPCDGGCPRCSPTIQPKLKIGTPDDQYEQEADRIAEQVMAMPEPAVQRAPT